MNALMNANLEAVIIVVGAYVFPTIIAIHRKHRQKLAIFILNLCLGWTLLGWVVSLVWACTADTKRAVST